MPPNTTCHTTCCTTQWCPVSHECLIQTLLGQTSEGPKGGGKGVGCVRTISTFSTLAEVSTCTCTCTCIHLLQFKFTYAPYICTCTCTQSCIHVHTCTSTNEEAFSTTNCTMALLCGLYCLCCDVYGNMHACILSGPQYSPIIALVYHLWSKHGVHVYTHTCIQLEAGIEL